MKERARQMAFGYVRPVPENNRVLRKVVYRRGPKVLSEADMNVCFYKSAHWKYEQEWRCVRSFMVSESRVAVIEPNLISHIIFGSRMETWQISRIVLYANALEMTQTQFLLSSPSRTSWTIENHPKKMSLCTNCQGKGYLMED